MPHVGGLSLGFLWWVNWCKSEFCRLYRRNQCLGVNNDSVSGINNQTLLFGFLHQALLPVQLPWHLALLLCYQILPSGFLHQQVLPVQFLCHLGMSVVSQTSLVSSQTFRSQRANISNIHMCRSQFSSDFGCQHLSIQTNSQG